MNDRQLYRGRLAPSPTGYLHLGHARTFWTAQERARANNGQLILRNDDLDQGRARQEYVDAMLEDMAWFGLEWSEGPDVGGNFGPYTQSERSNAYSEAFEALKASGVLYPCYCSRKDILSALNAPHQGDDEPVYPGTCRPGNELTQQKKETVSKPPCWRFRVPEGETVEFMDLKQGKQSFQTQIDFGDFVVWRPDGIPSYQLAVVVDDTAMKISEVVRGADLMNSTARQIMLHTALGLKQPSYFHCDLMVDEEGKRLAKRHDSMSLRNLRATGATPESIRKDWPSQGSA